MENNTSLSARKIIGESFGLAKKNFWNYFLVIVAFIILGILDPGEKDYAGSGLVSLIVTVASVYISISTFNATLKIVNGATVTAKDFFTWPKTGFKTFLTNIVASLVYLPLVIAFIIAFFAVLFSSFSPTGPLPIVPQIILLAILIPTLYFAIRILFAKYYSLEYGFMPGKAIREAWNASKGNFWLIFRLGVLSVLVGLLGIIALFIGIFWAAPTVIIAQMMLYKKLSGKVTTTVEAEAQNSLPEVAPLELQANPAPGTVSLGDNN